MKLQAVLFSLEEHAAIWEWSKTHPEIVVIMPTAVPENDLRDAIVSQDIWHVDSDGILIHNHCHYGRDELNPVVEVLQERNKKLFAVSNGEEPIQKSPNNEYAWQCEPETPGESRILTVLKDCRSTLRWLDIAEPTADVPEVHKEPIKILEKLGFVFRRNSRTFCLGRQRIKRVLARESHNLSFQCTFEDLIDRKCLMTW